MDDCMRDACPDPPATWRERAGRPPPINGDRALSPRPDSNDDERVYSSSWLITMADQSNLSYQAGEAADHAQARKEEVVEKAHDAASSAHDAAQEGVSQAGGLVQHASAQVQQIAQGAAGAAKSAADAVKNANGIGGN
ncbi:hypothetical protein ABZP36_014517 [Zizania latifolia]